jgi:hypothetical protein
MLIGPLPVILANLLRDMTEGEQGLRLNDRQLIVYDREPGQEMERLVSGVESELTPFAEAFPNLNPTDSITIYPLKMFKALGNYIKNASSDYLESILTRALNREIFNRLSTSDNILVDRIIPKNLVDGIAETQNNMINHTPSEVGDLTLSQIIDYVQATNFSEYYDVFQVYAHPIRLISAGLLYGFIVNTYVKKSFPMSTLARFQTEQAKYDWLRYRSRNIRIFMAFYAPLITLGIYHAANRSILDAIKIQVIGPRTSESLITLFFVPRFFANTHIKLNNQLRWMSNSSPPKNNRNFNYFKLLLIILLLILSIGLGNIWNAIHSLTYIKILFISIIAGSLYLIYLCIEFYALLYFIQNPDKDIPLYLPTYLFEWLKIKKDISKESPLGLRAFLDTHIRSIIGHIICISILFTFYILG